MGSFDYRTKQVNLKEVTFHNVITDLCRFVFFLHQGYLIADGKSYIMKLLVTYYSNNALWYKAPTILLSLIVNIKFKNKTKNCY